MTKVSVLGEEPKEKDLKKIELLHFIDSSSCFGDALCKPDQFDELILICRKYSNGFDAILALKESTKTIYFGHWNDGVV